MHILRSAGVCLIAVWLLAACQAGSNPAAVATQTLSQTDSAFSLLSEQQGFATAFRRYALDSAVLLPESRAPLENLKVIEQSLQALPAGTHLSWTLQGAEASDKLGYTWGIYTLTGRNAAGQQTVAYGKYLSVWRDRDGDWKLVVMMTNQSPGPAG